MFDNILYMLQSGGDIAIAKNDASALTSLV